MGNQEEYSPTCSSERLSLRRSVFLPSLQKFPYTSNGVYDSSCCFHLPTSGPAQEHRSKRLLWKTKTGSKIQETTGTSKLQGKMMYKNRRPHPVRDGKLQKPGVVRSNKKQVYMRKQNFPNHFYPPIPFCVTQFDPKDTNENESILKHR